MVFTIQKIAAAILSTWSRNERRCFFLVFRLAFLSAIATTPQFHRVTPRWTMSPASHPELPREKYYSKNFFRDFYFEMYI